MNGARAGGQSGFTLVEILVSMVVVSCIAGAVFYFLKTQNNMGVRSNDVMKATNLGKLVIDSLKVSDYDALEAGSDTLISRYIRAWRITNGTDDAGNPNDTRIIELTVYWPLTAMNSMTFTSLLSDSRFKEKP
jgi:prepilin-type N-terminal cleavage/methylation domain-containing protein